MSLPRIYRKIQKGNRIAVSEELLEQLGWKIDDQIVIEAYQGKLIVEKLDRVLKPFKERVS